MEYCGRCGAKVGDDQLFCHKCGGSLVEQRAMNDGATSEQRATSDDTPPEAHAATYTASTYTASTPAWTPGPVPASVPAPPAPAAPTGGEPTAPAITPSHIIASFTGYKGRVELYPAYLRIVHTGILARSSPNRGVTDILLTGLTDLVLTPPGTFTMGISLQSLTPVTLFHALPKPRSTTICRCRTCVVISKGHRSLPEMSQRPWTIHS